MKIFILGAAFVIGVCAPALASDSQPFTDAAYTFGIQDIQHADNTVSFTIPKNARKIDEAADAVVLSGLYDNAKPKPTKKCPVVSSYHVTKKIKSYDPFSGRARLIATFNDAQIAETAYKEGCLLVNDPN